MKLRRAGLWLCSVAFGLASVLGALRLFDTSLERFALPNALLIFLSMGALAFIWLDFVFRTNYLRS